MGAIIVTLVEVAILAGLGYWGYIGIPGWFVAKFPTKVVGVEDQQVKIAARKKTPVRLFMGLDLKVKGNDFSKHEDFDLMQRNGSEPQNGGELSFLIRVLDSWIFSVKGSHLLAVKFPDLFNSDLNIVTYDLKRVSVEKGKDGEWTESLKKGADGEIDRTDHFRHSIDVSDILIDDVETTKIMKVPGAKGVIEDVPQRIVISLLVGCFLRVENPVKAYYQTAHDYLPYFRDVAKAEFREVLQDMGYDQLLMSDIKTSVVAKVLPITQAELNRVGLRIVNFKVKDIIPEKAFRDALNQQGIATAKGQARVTAAIYDVAESEQIKMKDKHLAEGQAAYKLAELNAIATGGAAIRNVVRSHELARDVIVANLHSEGVRLAKNGTIFVTAGGAQAPMPVLPVGPSSISPDDDGGDDETGKPASSKKANMTKVGGKTTELSLVVEPIINNGPITISEGASA